MKRFYKLTPKSRRVLYPLLIVGMLDFLGFWFQTGASAFPLGGRVRDGHYVVRDHGRDYELTSTQFWLSYIHGASCAVLIFGYVGAFLYFRQTGDLKRVTSDS